MRRRAFVMLGIFLFMVVGLLVALASQSLMTAGIVIAAASLVGLVLYNVVVYLPPLLAKRVSTTCKQATATVKANAILKG